MVLCLEVSVGTWGLDPVLYQRFAIQNRTEVISDQKQIIQKWVRLPRPRQDLETLPTALPAGFSTMKGNPVLFSVFWCDIVGLITRAPY